MFGDPSKMVTYWGLPLNPDDPANPCGLFARAFFNDTYTMYDAKGSSIDLNQTNISDKYSSKEFYKRYKDYETTQWMDVENGIMRNENIRAFH